ncbi:AAEL010425-PA [Aedes aegypti]|uniref:AAEL010425-PA n=1 Tax=Aedes aegypti TaxID=7159 RepID=Q16T25_AEDAE|nr:AAEL010425-PA [Aedes aegypti]
MSQLAQYLLDHERNPWPRSFFANKPSRSSWRKDERSERLKVQANEYKEIVANLEPLHVPQPKDDRLEQLEQETTKGNHDWIMSLIRGAEMPVTRIIDHENQQKHNQQQIKTKAEQLACEIIGE